MKRLMTVIISLLFLMMVFSGCSSGNSKEENNRLKVPVEVMQVRTGEIIQSIHYNGDIRAEIEVKVFSKIPDRIETYFVDEGDHVKKGEPVARIIATTIEQAVRQAEAGLLAANAQAANMEVEYARAERLRRENVMSEQQFDLIKTQYEATKAQVEQAEAAVISMKSQYRDATITAPISGIVAKKYFENGDMTNMASPLLEIVQMDRVKIMVSVTEEDLGKVGVGQQANIRVRSFRDRSFTGTVNKISPTLDPKTRMAEMEILVDNREGLLKPGMYAEVEVVTGILKDVLVIPRFASIESNTMETIDGKDRIITNYYVYVIKNGIANQKKLDITYVNHRNMAVHSALNIGDTLVVAGQNNLRDGVGVTIVRERGDLL